MSDISEALKIAHVRVELPFQLMMPEGRYPMILEHRGGYDVVDTFIWPGRVWALGYKCHADDQHPWLLTKAAETALVPVDEVATPAFLDSWRQEQKLDAVAVFPVGTLVSWSIKLEDFPKDVVGWAADTHLPARVIDHVNHILLQYRVAHGFTSVAGLVGSVSEVELLTVSVQLFAGKKPQSPEVFVRPHLPGLRYASRMPLPDQEIVTRFRLLLGPQGYPLLPVTLAYNVHSLLYRRRYEEAFFGFWQSIEVALAMAESTLGLKAKGSVAEVRLQRVIAASPACSDGVDYTDQVRWARRVRNTIVHEGSMQDSHPKARENMAVRLKDVTFDILKTLEPLIRRKNDA